MRDLRLPARPLCLMIALAAGLGSCGDGKELRPPGELGELALAIEVAPGVTVTRLDYRVLRNGAVVISGTADTTEAALIQLEGLPAGTDYVVELSGVNSQGVHCTGSARFTVTAQSSVVVSVPMSCGSASRGRAQIIPDFGGCTRVAAIAASDLPGRNFSVSVVASAGSVTPTYLWSSAGGSFDDPSSAQTAFHCGQAAMGPTTVTATVSDATCTDSVATVVDCGTPPVLGLCGDGVVNAGEACDAADLPTASCDETCTALPNTCSGCTATNCPVDVVGCAGLTGAERGQCQAVVACAYTSQCVGSDADGIRCYCGAAELGACLNGLGDGACRAVIEAAAGSTDPNTVGQRFTDPAFPLGRAMNLFGCRAALCGAECPLSAGAPRP